MITYPSIANNSDVKLFKPVTELSTKYFKEKFAATSSPEETLNLIRQLLIQYRQSNDFNYKVNLKRLFRNCLRIFYEHANTVEKEAYVEIATGFVLETIQNILESKAITDEQFKELEKYTCFTIWLGTDDQKAELAAQYRESKRIAEANRADEVVLTRLEYLLELIHLNCPHWRSGKAVAMEPGF